MYEPMTAETYALRREALAIFARGLAACYGGESRGGRADLPPDRGGPTSSEQSS